MATVWQIAAGDFGRDYSRLFLDHDLMFEGPGEYGPYDPEVYKTEAIDTGLRTAQKIGMIRSLCEKIVPGDVVLLRRGHRVLAIGLIPDGEGYQHDPTFDDVYGWDLQHTRRVIWQRHLSKELDGIQASSDLFHAAKMIPTFTRVRQAAILDRIKHLMRKCTTRSLEQRPDFVSPPLSMEELGQQLFSKGLPNDAVDKVLLALQRQRRLLSWYRMDNNESGRPDEHEVVAHMILPLLLALGWSEQLLAVEWHNVDAAGFRGTPTTPEGCVLVCEAKRMEHGLQTVFEQAIRYVHKLHLGNCRKILLSQGGRFYLYQGEGDPSDWKKEAAGYLNVEKIRTNHIAPANTSAVNTLMALTPAGVQHDVI